MIESQANFGQRLKEYLKENKYSLRFYGELTESNHSTLRYMMANDTLMIKDFIQMAKHDTNLLKVLEDLLNTIFPEEKNQIQFSQVAEPQATYQTKPPNQNNKEIINLQRELIQLQQEVIRLNKEIIKLSK